MTPDAHAKSSPASTLFLFFLATYAVLWACFFTVAFRIPASTPLGYALVLFGVYSPSMVALALTARAEGSAGVRDLLSGVIRWRVAWPWYVFAAGYMVAIKLSVALIIRVATGAWPRFGTEPLYLIPLAIVFLSPFQAGEEIGWRGYALPRLASRFGLPIASVVLGLIWGFWHLPQFFIREADTFRQSFPVYVLQVTAISVAMAWLWAKTNRSLLFPMLLHSAVNNSKDIVPSAVPGGTDTFGFGASLVGWLTVILLWVCAAYFLRDMPKTESPVQS